MCKVLDLALTPNIIKSGFRATGISPFDPDIFSESDFVQTIEQNKIETECEVRVNEEEQCRNVVPGVGHKAAVLTVSEPSTSKASSVNCLSLLEEIGPLQAVTPKKHSNCGRKPVQSTVLTNPECIASLKAKPSKKAAKSAPMQSSVLPQKKRGRKLTSDEPAAKHTKVIPSKPAAKRTKA